MTDRPDHSSGDPEGPDPEGTEGTERQGGQADAGGLEGMGLPPELRELLGALTGGGALDPRSLDPSLLDPQAIKALQDQLEAMGLGRVDPAALQSMAAQVRAMFAQPVEGPLNAQLALDTARRVVSSEGDSSVGDGARRHVVDSVHVADLWLDDVTALPAPAAPAHGWSRAEWVDATMPVWRSIVAPIAEGVATAVGAAMRQQVEQLGAEALPEGMLPEGVDPAALIRQMEPMLGSMSASMFGVQLGQAVGTLAGDILSGTEVGLPLVADHGVALVPANIAEFAQGLGIDEEQVRLYLAVRESARSRLFAGVPWLAPQLLTAVQDYARDIRIDTEAIEAQLQSVDASDPQALQEALQHSLFSPTPSEAQKAALGRLETLLALVEGWVDTVAARASTPHLPQADALGEAMRRRRASGGPAEKTFSALVGLELRPRRLRDAANLWAAVEDRHGPAARDAAWGHPDVAPTAADLDDPLGFVEKVTGRAAGDDVDVALDEILRGDSGD
ncbi:MAG TPA: zinc-dependent metalloprotease [Dermatophilaceae bacterium]|nr:zinc-dependent metalloprotease [Dermatophilaceae bacterium]